MDHIEKGKTAAITATTTCKFLGLLQQMEVM